MINLEYYEIKKILILGFGKEGISTLKFLRKKFPKKLFGIADQKKLSQLEQGSRKLIKADKNLELYLGEDYQRTVGHYDIIFKSPGIRITNVSRAEVTSQTRIFFGLFRDKIVGVTGTKGKTTTSSLIYKILKDAKFNVEFVGNVGNPPFDIIDKISEKTFFVYELSSFQLQDLKVSPHISVFLNLYKEHLDYHGGYENYQKAKTNIVKWQNEKDFAIYNLDSLRVAEIVKIGKASKIPYSLERELKGGSYVSGKWAFFNSEKVLKVSQTKLKGRFNLNNILAAISVAKLFKVPNKSIVKSVKTFQPIKHRLEFIGRFHGIDFYNDSIATIPEATIAALETLKPNVSTLIVGGYNRRVDYLQLSKKIIEEKIPNLILFPQTGRIILDGIENQTIYKPKHFFVKNMKEAVEIAGRLTQKGKICLMSPASSSFNMFKNYQDRGEQFIKFVKKLSSR